MRVYLLLAIAHLFVSSTVISSIEANQKLCNAPSKTILNGKRSSLATEQFKIGSTVRYWCQSGYYIRGSRYLKCILRNGKAQWIGRPPICVGYSYRVKNEHDSSRSSSDSGSSGGRGAGFRRCPILKINNGWVKQTKSPNRRIFLAHYYCKKGWVLVGKKRRVCGFNERSWSGSPPLCKRRPQINCGDPGTPKNGRRRLSTTTKGSVVKYYCKNQFKLVGNSKRICTDKGWSGKLPICDPIQCFNLHSPKYGTVILSGRTVSSIATYTCKKGFKLLGTRARRCQKNGGWTGKKPVCKCFLCGQLSNPVNGVVKFHSTKKGSRALYSCNNGYRLRGSRERVCQKDCSWSGVEPLCKRDSIDCGALPAPKYGSVILTGTTPGATALYECDKGFRLIGYETRKCSEIGVWSKEPPICQPTTCASLEPPVNGAVNMTGQTFGSTATYYCFPGFRLVGEAIQHCQENGEWSGVAPSCKPVDCGGLNSPTNGGVEYEDTLFQSVAVYSCQAGYEISGDETRNCEENGLWSGIMPSCEPIDCGVLAHPTHGKVKYSDTVFNSVATYSCQLGYEIVGTSRRTCGANKQWSGEAPICKVINCGRLVAPSHGFVDFQETVFESAATYSCEEGYELVGDYIRLCEGSGSWSGDTPTCTPVDCGSLSHPINGYVNVQSTTLGSVATYSCIDSYQLSHYESRVCQSNADWSGEEPICESLEGTDCGFLADPVGGAVTLSGTFAGEKAEYTCNEGYIKSGGDSVRVCQENQKWSGEAAICDVIVCPELVDPPNGHVVNQENTYGSQAVYFCDQGFHLIGQDQRQCSSGGTWTGQQPTCKKINCGPLPNLEKGVVSFQSTEFLSIARYSCNNGYKLMGSPERECMANGKWSGSEPICSATGRCVVLSDPRNGTVSVEGMNAKDSIATYVCDFGFALVRGDRERVCQGSVLGWSGTEPSCQMVECPALSNPTNGIVSFSQTTVFSKATYSCNDGYFLNGPQIRECQANGAWSGIAPTCQEIIMCPPLADIQSGSVSFNNTSEGSLATYECLMGYKISSGDMVRECQSDEKWSGEEPTCSPVDCGSLDAPENGQVIVSGTTFRSTATYRCEGGFQLVGENMRYCQANGDWAGNEPFCQVINVQEMCDDPGIPINGVRIGNSLSVGSVLFYRCKDGFILLGSKYRKCQENGVFSGMQPTCAPFNDTCQGSTTEVYDECNRRCECVNQKLVQCTRWRQDWAKLSSDDKLRYINAVKTVASDPNYKPRYEALVKQYEDSADTDAQITEPSTSQFIPYNRYFMLQYENLLKEIDCRITIPYWDWTAFPVNPYRHPVWDNRYGFGNTSRPTDECVATGPFRFDQFQIPDIQGGYTCIHRDYNDNKFPRREAIDRDILPLPASQFRTVHRQLQVFLGINALCYVGGDLCSLRPAYDPVFLLHLSNVDFIFDRWQRFGEGRETVRYADDSKPLVFGAGLTVSELKDNKALPGGVIVSYEAPVFHKNHLPPFLITI